MTEVLRIANCSGFYGDRLAAAREMVEGGPIDVLAVTPAEMRWVQRKELRGEG